ncbi:general substrate transporter [Dendrothele bispora CBS 962.96]|uniref:General substrate transporter n=1 Tax=Dendrothele bispora (strain CBS 962.96) TaxID=1314807 RepID=A0A4S8MVQ9_DENBC|nr:general substrate transporter [Dendrothele bispora CBS 962.96]
MAGGAVVSTNRRRALAGESGWRGLVRNRRIFAMAVFASLGGFLSEYLQGVFSSVLPMHAFTNRMHSWTDDTGRKGWLVAILELGAWVGVLATGPLADILSRKNTILLAVVIFCIGVVFQTAAQNPSWILGGRFVTGMGVGSLSMAVPLYNAEMSPPEVRGSLVALQQLAITFGIMISFWIDFGTNFIGGTGDTQSEAAWRIPLALQLVPALVLGVGMIFMPFSPRWLVNQGRDDEAITVLSNARGLAPDNELVKIEFLEIKAQHLFEQETSRARFPLYQDGSRSSNFKLGMEEYMSLFTNRALLWRTAVGSITMFFQQWTGVNAILYYAPTIFTNLGLQGNTVPLLATGVVGIAMFLATIPAVIWIDQVGRKPVLVSGAFLMAACHLIVAILTARFQSDWPAHSAAGWAACALVWLFAVAFGYSWGPCGWVLVAEIYPLSVRGKAMSVASSSNWMNNFIVGQVTPTMIEHLTFGTFIFFGVFSLLGGLFILFLVPETKGVTLEEMEEVFDTTGSNLAVEDQKRLDAIHQRLGLIDDFHPKDSHDDDLAMKA